MPLLGGSGVVIRKVRSTLNTVIQVQLPEIHEPPSNFGNLPILSRRSTDKLTDEVEELFVFRV